MGTNRRVLVVDDMADGRYLLESILKDGDYEVVTATDGKDALEKLRAGVFDLIISDVLMPNMDGFELCRVCSHDKELAGIPLIFYTANYIGKKDEAFAISLGAKAYLRKPMEPDELIANIERVITDNLKASGQPSVASTEDVRIFLHEHNRRLVDKLAEKVEALEAEVAERKQAQGELQASNALLSSVVESPDNIIIFVLDTKYNYLCFNLAHVKKMKNVYGADIEVGHNILTYILVEDDRLKAEENYKQVLTGERFVKTEEYGETDSRYWYELIFNPIKNTLGHVTGFTVFVTEITDRKRAEKALKESEQKYRSLFDNMIEGFAYCEMIFDADGKPIDFVNLVINDAFERLTGLKRETVIDKKFTEVIPGIKESNPEIFNIYGNVAITGKEAKFETFITPLDLWLSISVYSPKKGYFVAVLDNITERKHAEKTLIEANTIINRSPAVAFLWKNEENWPVEFVSDNVKKLFGYSAQDFQEGKVVYLKLIHKDDQKMVADEVEKYSNIAGLKTFVHKPYRIITKSGDIKWIDDVTYIRRDSSGTITHYEGIVEDITERKQAESANMELGRLIEDSLNEVYVFNAKTLRFVMVNAGARNNTGYSIEELRDMTPLDIKPELTVESFLGLLTPISTGKTDRIRFETVHKRKDGSTYPVEIHLQLTTYESNAAYVAMIIDITERKKAEEQILQETELTKNLLRLSDALSNTTILDDLMDKVANITREITVAKIVVTYLWDNATNTFRPESASGVTSDILPIFKTTTIGLDSTIIKDTMDSGRIYIESSMNGSGPLKLQQDGLFGWIKNARAISILPLIGKRAYLGLIVCGCFNDSVPEPFDSSDKQRELMQAVANQVSMALDEALHYKESVTRAMELAQKVETIETMSEISKSILSMLDIKEIIEVTARMVHRLIPCDWVRIIEVDAVKEELRLIAGFEEAGLLESKVVPFTSTNLVEVIDSRRPQYIADLQTVDSPLAVERDLVKRGYQSVLRIPITVKGRVPAVLGLMSKRTSAFGPDDLQVLEKLSNQVGVAIENARLVKDLKDLSFGTVRALAETIDAKSPWTHGHSERVTGVALKIGKELGFNSEELGEFRIAGLLHDIGKIAVSESVLDKPGKLTDEEYGEMKAHPVKGAEILAPIKQLTHILPIIRGHHEFYDGTGYPDGLKGAEIPLQARILTVADTVDAMGADRPYRKGLSGEKIVAELKRCSGTQFDPVVVEAYFKVLEKESDEVSM